MNIPRNDLYRIILEEYLKEEGSSLDEDKAQELIDYIKGGPKPDWYDDEKPVPPAPKVPPADIHGAETQAFSPPEEQDDSETYPMDIPSDDAGADIETQLASLIQGMEPEAVAELFQSVFEKIPGVELSRPGDEDYPGEETLYSPGAEGRPVAGFQLENLMELIREVLEEGHYHDMGDEDEVYNVLNNYDFSNFDPAADWEEFEDAFADDPSKIPDHALGSYAKEIGLEKFVVYDYEGDLMNREEVENEIRDELPKLQASDNAPKNV